MTNASDVAADRRGPLPRPTGTLVHRAWADAIARAGAVALAIVSASAALAAEPGPAAFRSEIIPFDSADLPLQALLTGGPTTVSGRSPENSACRTRTPLACPR